MKKVFKYVIGSLPKDVDYTNLTAEQEKQLKEFYNVEFKDVIVLADTYGVNGSLAVKLMSRPDEDDAKYFGLSEEESKEFSSVFSVITKNLSASVLLPEDTQFVDEENNPGIGRWLIQNKIAKRTRYTARSGFVTYRAYKFDKNSFDN